MTVPLEVKFWNVRQKYGISDNIKCNQPKNYKCIIQFEIVIKMDYFLAEVATMTINVVGVYLL